VDHVWPLTLLLCFTIGPILVLRFLFGRAKWKWLSSHSTAYAVTLTLGAWAALFGVSLSYFASMKMSYPLPKGDSSLPSISHADPVAAALEDEVRNLQAGKIAFDVPPTMREGKQEQVEVRIARGVTADVEQLLKEKMRSTAQVDDIKVAPFMIVELNDADGSTFKIVPLTQDRQSVASDDYTKWVWVVTPLQSGQQTLYLSVGTRFKLPNSTEEARFTPIYDKAIAVQVDRMYETKHFLSGNWQWITVTLLIPLIGFIWHHRKKKPKETVFLP
jgi:hypothetical protein